MFLVCQNDLSRSKTIQRCLILPACCCGSLSLHSRRNVFELQAELRYAVRQQRREEATKSGRRRAGAGGWAAASSAALVTRRRLLACVAARPGVALRDLLADLVLATPFSPLAASDAACSLFICSALQLRVVRSPAACLFAPSRSQSISLHVFLHPRLSLYAPGPALQIHDTVSDTPAIVSNE